MLQFTQMPVSRCHSLLELDSKLSKPRGLQSLYAHVGRKEEGRNETSAQTQERAVFVFVSEKPLIVSVVTGQAIA